MNGIAQKNGILWHICHVLLKKRLFLSNTRLVCLKAAYFEATAQGDIT
jgi:hypothetical protein